MGFILGNLGSRAPSAYDELLQFEQLTRQTRGDTAITTPISSQELQVAYGLVLALNQVVSLISKQIAPVMPMIMSQQGVDVSDTPQYSVFRRPNDWYTWLELSETLVTHFLVTGEVFIEKVIETEVEARLGQVKELWPLPTSICEPIASKRDFIKGFKVGVNQTETITLSPERMFYMNTPNLDSPWRGLSPASPAVRDLVTDRLMAQWNQNFFKLGARPMGVLQRIMPGGGRPEDLERTAADFAGYWNDSPTGTRPKIPVLPFGMDLKEFSLNHDDMEFLRGRAYIVAEMAAAYHVPPSFMPQLRFMSETNRAQSETDTLNFIFLTLIPLIKRLEQKLSADRVLMRMRDKFTLKTMTMPAIRQALFAGDLRQFLQNGTMTPNEVREVVGLLKSEQAGANDLHVDKTQIPLDKSRELADAEQTLESALRENAGVPHE